MPDACTKCTYTVTRTEGTLRRNYFLLCTQANGGNPAAKRLPSRHNMFSFPATTKKKEAHAVQPARLAKQQKTYTY